MEIKNAKIIETFLGYEDHGIFGGSITVDYGGSQQGLGIYGLKNKFAEKFITSLIDVTDVYKWEKLKGQNVRIQIENGLIVAVGHFLKDKWFYPKKMREE